MIVAGHDRRCPPGLERQLQVAGGALQPGRVGRERHDHHFPGRCGAGQRTLEPLSLRGDPVPTVGFVRVRIEDKELHRSLSDRVIALVARQAAKEVQVSLVAGRVIAKSSPVVFAHAGKEAVGGGARPVGTAIGIDEVMVVLANGRVVQRAREGGRAVIVIAGSGYKVRIPAMDEVGHILFRLLRYSIVAEDSKANGRSGRRQAIFERLQNYPRGAAAFRLTG